MSFNLSIHSSQAVSGNFGAKEYYFDWTNFEECDYNVSFTFISSNEQMDTAYFIAAIETPDLYITNTYKPSSTRISALTSGILGITQNKMLSGHNSSTNHFMYTCASRTDNAPVRVQKPANSRFRVRLLNDELAEIGHDANRSYLLVLHFENIES